MELFVKMFRLTKLGRLVTSVFVFDRNEVRMPSFSVSYNCFVSHYVFLITFFTLRLRIGLELFRTVRRPYCSVNDFLSVFCLLVLPDLWVYEYTVSRK